MVYTVIAAVPSSSLDAIIGGCIAIVIVTVCSVMALVTSFPHWFAHDWDQWVEDVPYAGISELYLVQSRVCKTCGFKEIRADRRTSSMSLGHIPFEDLIPLVTESKSTGKWFFSPYQQMWFSLPELQTHWEKGRFHWGAVNWKLRDPGERLKELEAELKNVEVSISEFKMRMAKCLEES